MQNNPWRPPARAAIPPLLCSKFPTKGGDLNRGSECAQLHTAAHTCVSRAQSTDCALVLAPAVRPQWTLRKIAPGVFGIGPANPQFPLSTPPQPTGMSATFLNQQPVPVPRLLCSLNRGGGGHSSEALYPEALSLHGCHIDTICERIVGVFSAFFVPLRRYLRDYQQLLMSHYEGGRRQQEDADPQTTTALSQTTTAFGSRDPSEVRAFLFSETHGSCTRMELMHRTEAGLLHFLFCISEPQRHPGAVPSRVPHASIHNPFHASVVCLHQAAVL